MKASKTLKVGDLVRVKHTDADIRNRHSGIILRFDSCFLANSREKMHITEVIWDDEPAWIDTNRIELIQYV
jgi:hypothetical protein